MIIKISMNLYFCVEFPNLYYLTEIWDLRIVEWSLSMERSMKLFEKFLNTLKDIQTILKQDAPQVIWKTTSSPIAPISKNRQCRFISLTVSF